MSLSPAPFLPPYPTPHSQRDSKQPSPRLFSQGEEETEEEGPNRPHSAASVRSSDGEKRAKSKKPSSGKKSSGSSSRETKTRGLEEELKNYKTENAYIKAQYEVQANSLNELRRQLLQASEPDPYKNMDENASAQLEQARRNLQDLDRENQEVNGSLRTLMGDLERANNEKEEALAGNASLLSRVEQLEVELSRQRQPQTTPTDNEGAEKLQQVTRERDTLLEERQAGAREREQISAQLDSLATSVRQLRGEKEALQRDHDQELTRLRSEVERKLAALSAHRLDQPAAGSSSLEETKTLTHQLGEKSEALRHLEGRYSSLEREITGAAQENQVLTQRLQRAEKEREMYQGALLGQGHDQNARAAVTSIQRAAEQRISLVERDCAQRIRDLEDRLQIQAGAKIGALTRSYEEQIRILRQKVSELNEQLTSQITSLDASLDELLESKLALERKLEEAKQMIDQRTRKAAQLEQDTAKLRAQLEAADKKVAEERARTQGQQARSHMLQSQLEEADSERRALRPEIDNLRVQLRTQIGEISQAKKELETYKSLIATTEKKLEAAEGERLAVQTQQLQAQVEARLSMEKSFQEQSSRLAEKELELAKEADEFSKISERLKKFKESLQKKEKELQIFEKELQRGMPRPRRAHRDQSSRVTSANGVLPPMILESREPLPLSGNTSDPNVARTRRPTTEVDRQNFQRLDKDKQNYFLLHRMLSKESGE